jgi:5-oxoprolinase (ATP-hydrolysing)
MANNSNKKWHFWVDRGGTFTDVVARRPDGSIVTHKLLSQSEHYQNSSIQGICDVLGVSDKNLISNEISEVRMGTTLGTNALLERKGSRVALVITKGFADALKISYQDRPDIFALNIVLPKPLYSEVIEVSERYTVNGDELISINEKHVRQDLQLIYDKGIRSLAIVFIHAYKYTKHEVQVAKIAEEMGFTQISLSSEVSPLQKLISRGDTTLVDAYLTPILHDYIDSIVKVLHNTRLFFMQSNGGLTSHTNFRGRDSVLSDPASGVIGAIKTGVNAGFEKLINFDMGGTSTDVSHFSGEYERDLDTYVAGVHMRVPMMRIHTVAAGGSSVCGFDGMRFHVGPESAAASPGPACYRKNGPLTITDCNVLLGRLNAEFFPKVFGKNANKSLDTEIVHEHFIQLAQKVSKATGKEHTPEQVANGYLKIAIDNMANAIKEISVQRGYNVSEYTLCCFGGAGGQHACLVADALGIEQIFIHHYAGVLSAYGMGLADFHSLREQSVESELTQKVLGELEQVVANITEDAIQELVNQDVKRHQIKIKKRLHLHYRGISKLLSVSFNSDADVILEKFAYIHQKRYGFIREDKKIIIEAISVEAIGISELLIERKTVEKQKPKQLTKAKPLAYVNMNSNCKIYRTPVYERDDLQPCEYVMSPAIIIETTGTNIIEPGWKAEVTLRNELLLTKQTKLINDKNIQKSLTNKLAKLQPDPVMLEIFNNLFRSIADQMGVILANSAYSVNIKERLDFSCAIFDQNGSLIANAPHIPVHLGSMSDSVQAVIKDKKDEMQTGDVFVLNNPYHGGTHLPDVTVVTPVFHDSNNTILFYLASRGHQADIGGISPGSVPPFSKNITEEGVLINTFKLVSNGKMRENEIKKILMSGKYPTRNPEQNLADLRAQISANVKGVKELDSMVKHYGLDIVQAYMQHVQDNAEQAVKEVLCTLEDGEFSYSMDNGAEIKVKISIDKSKKIATIDFTGTSKQQENNFNAPSSVCKAAALYVFRTLVKGDIPLNAGCLKPLHLIIPKDSLLNPVYPAAVVAGNVETSQCITDALYGALGIMAASQGTMNNFTFGNDEYQYYETICGGAGAGSNFHGADAVQTNMTNSRLTDPEVLEWRFPVLLEEFSIRKNSGGKGVYNGGNGVKRKLRFLKPMRAAILSGRRIIPPYGMAGGNLGKVGKNYIIRKDGKIENLAGIDEVNINADDIFVIETPGGGGYGKPKK